MIKKNKGMTIIEILVASFIFFIITTIIFFTLFMTQDYWKVIDNKTEAQLNCMMSLDKMKVEASVSDIQSFTVINDTNLSAVSFMVPRDYSGDPYYFGNTNEQLYTSGNLYWKNYLIYYWNKNTAEIKRRAIAINPMTTAISPLSSLELEGYCNGSGRVISLDVINFNANLYSNYVLFTLNNSVTYANKASAVGMTVRCYPKN